MKRLYLAAAITAAAGVLYQQQQQQRALADGPRQQTAGPAAIQAHHELDERKAKLKIVQLVFR
jgi:hypothetical protein